MLFVELGGRPPSNPPKSVNRPGSSVGSSVRLKSERSPVRSRPWPQETSVQGFIKHTSHGPDYFAVEAAGLRWLADAGPDAARTVEVLAVDDHHIELEQLQPARPTRADAEAFGRALAVTHAAGADAFGQPPPGVGSAGYIGRQRMAMVPTDQLGRLLRRAADARVRPARPGSGHAERSRSPTGRPRRRAAAGGRLRRRPSAGADPRRPLVRQCDLHRCRRRS